MSSFSFLTIDDVSRSIYIKKGNQILDRDLIIPQGYKIFANSNVSIDLKNHAKIISYSAFIFTGTEDYPVIIESSDSTSDGIELIGAPKSIFNYVTFKNFPKVNDSQWARSAALTFYESPVEFNNCCFYNSKAEDVLNLIRSGFVFKECLFHKAKGTALNIDFSDGTINNCVFEDCSKNALDITMGKVSLMSVYINGTGNKAINIKGGSQINGDDIRIKNSFIAISAEDLATADLQNVSITQTRIGIVAYSNKSKAGHPTLKISGLVLKEVKSYYLNEKKSSVFVNGININDETDNVEDIIKGEKKKNK
jgi:hypothetical protein